MYLDLGEGKLETVISIERADARLYDVPTRPRIKYLRAYSY